ncbi:MAG: exo-alpha-sialidase [Saprospiraceae bacterium]|nr:exo-alpha-sialidase [Saprospiraceae bacterium]
MKRRSTIGCSPVGWIAVLTVALSSCAVKPDFASQAVTEPETVLRLEFGEDNPRNSEGDFVELKDGKILFVYSHYYGSSSSDHGTAYLASRVSSDRGRTWSTRDKIEVDNEGDMNIMSVSLLRLKSGEIALFYARKNSLTDCIPMMRISKDEAATWGDPVTCVRDREGYFVLNNDRVIQRPDGRLLVPVSQHNYPGGSFSLGGIIYCYYSDDNGKTWESSEAVPNPDSVVLQEPGLVILKDNSILMFMRTNAGTQIFSKSTDGGMNWSLVNKSQLISPRSPATIERIPQTDDLLAVWNCNLSMDEEISKKRTPLNIAISQDEGISWERIKMLEGDPMGWYCYTAMQFVDEQVLLGYCAGNQATGGLNDTSIKSVNLSWVYQGNQK